MHALTRPAQPFDEAAEASIAAGDYGRALTLIGEQWPSFATMRGRRLRDLVGRIPERHWNGNARIIAALGASYASVESPNAAAALPHFELAERLIATGASPQADLPAIRMHHSACLRSLGRIDAARATAESAWLLLQDDLAITLPLRLQLQAEASLQLGILSLHRGEIPSAVDRLRTAVGLGAGMNSTALLEGLGSLAVAAYSMGDFELAEQQLRLATGTADDAGLAHTAFMAPALAAQTLMAVDRNDAAGAGAAAASLAVSAQHSDWEPLAFYARAATAAVNGQLIESLDLLRRCLAAARGWDAPPAVTTSSELLRASVHLHLGEPARAMELVKPLTPDADHVRCPATLMASIQFADGRLEDCLTTLASCSDRADTHSNRTLIDVLLLTAAAHHELGNLVQADVAFDQALYLGAQTGIRVAFLVIPRIAMLRMLNRAADRYQPDRVHRLLDELRVGSVTATVLTEPLSDRELDIAHHLFQDKTVNQIAAELFISANTVKTHVRSIYRKLSATSRQEAIRRVHELGLDVRITPF